jgi:hypothetical protein
VVNVIAGWADDQAVSFDLPGGSGKMRLIDLHKED